MYWRDMLSFLRSFVTRVVACQTPAVILGRWGIQYDPRIIDCKVFQANEDHCGCCAVPAPNPAPTAVENNMKVDEKGEEYLVPYVM